MAVVTLKYAGYTLLLDHAADQLGFVSQVSPSTPQGYLDHKKLPSPRTLP